MSLISILNRSDRAENSIMQTISIAVSAILIASGLVTAPGLINNARDSLARTDLANLAYAQEFALANVGQYYRYLTSGQEFEKTGENNGDNLYDAVISNSGNDSGNNTGGGGNGDVLGNQLAASDGTDNGNNTGFKFSFSGTIVGHEARVCQDPSFFIMKDYSPSGKWFYRGSESGTTSSNIGDIIIPAAVLASCPDIIDGFEGGTPVDPGNPTDPVNGDDIPIPAGAAKLNVDVNSIVGSDYFLVSGYKENDTSHLSFGGGNIWTPDWNSEISLSYYDPATTSLVPFYSANIPNPQAGVDRVLVQYDDFSGKLFGRYEGYDVTASNIALFAKFKTNGGSMTFTSGETKADVTVVWYPSTGDAWEYYPAFPAQALYRDKWIHLDDNPGAEYMFTNSDGMKSVTIARTAYDFGDGEGGLIRYSTNGGVTSQPAKGPDYGIQAEYFRSFDVSNDGDMWWALTQSKKVYSSSNQGSSWTEIDFNNIEPISIDVSEDGSKIAFGGDNGEVGVISNGSMSYHDVPEIAQGAFAYKLKWSPDGKLYLQTINKVYVSNDGGSTFSYISDLGIGQWGVMDMSADGATVVMTAGASTGEGGLHISYDHGVTWTYNPGNLDAGYVKVGESVSISADGQSILISIEPPYNGGYGYLWVSHDAGSTWKQQEGPGLYGQGDWSTAVSDDFSRIYAVNGRNYTTSTSGMWVHIAGETECYENCN